jgi:hypothetical protein
MRAVIGIDPGIRGGVVVLDQFKMVKYVYAFRPDLTEREFTDIIRTATVRLHECGGDACFIEKVGYIRGDGGQGAFTFGKLVGLIHGTLLCQEIRLVHVMPSMWQSKMRCLSGGNKNVTKHRAIELFPSEKVTHATADALLIAAYGYQHLNDASRV